MMAAISREIWQKPIQAGFAGFALLLLGMIYWQQDGAMRQANINMSLLLTIQERSLEQRALTATAIERNTAAMVSVQQTQDATTRTLAGLRRCIELRFGTLEEDGG